MIDEVDDNNNDVDDDVMSEDGDRQTAHRTTARGAATLKTSPRNDNRPYMYVLQGPLCV